MEEDLEGESEEESDLAESEEELEGSRREEQEQEGSPAKRSRRLSSLWEEEGLQGALPVLPFIE